MYTSISGIEISSLPIFKMIWRPIGVEQCCVGQLILFGDSGYTEDRITPFWIAVDCHNMWMISCDDDESIFWRRHVESSLNSISHCDSFGKSSNGVVAMMCMINSAACKRRMTSLRWCLNKITFHEIKKCLKHAWKKALKIKL